MNSITFILSLFNNGHLDLVATKLGKTPNSPKPSNHEVFREKRTFHGMYNHNLDTVFNLSILKFILQNKTYGLSLFFRKPEIRFFFPPLGDIVM